MKPLPLDDEVIARATDAQPPRVICAWCPDFDRTKQQPVSSHGLCAACRQKILDDLDRRAPITTSAPKETR